MSDDKALNEADQSSTEPTPTPTPSAGRKRPVIKKRVGAKKRVEEIQQPDEFMEVGGTVVDWVIERRKPAGMLIGGILAALLIYGVMGRLDRGNREDASQALYAAQRLLPESTPITSGLNITLADPTTDADIAAAVTALDKVAADFKGTPQAALAQLEAGATLYREGDYAEALPYFEAASSAKGAAGVLATSSKGSTLESLDRLDEAVTAFEAVRASGKAGTKEQATIDLARVLVAKGDTARAAELYTQFETDFPDSAVLAEVQAKVAAIR